MPTIPQILEWLQFINTDLTLFGLVFTAGTILVTRDWRILILALLMQYILLGVILSRLVRPDIAVLQVLIGAFICPILFLSARQVSASSASIIVSAAKQHTHHNRLVRWWYDFSVATLLFGPAQRNNVPATGFFFRIVLVLLLILVTMTLSNTFPLPGQTASITAAVYWLVLTGLLTLTLTESPLKVGLGLFTFFMGFGLYYAVIENSLLLIGLWGSVNLLLALAIGYLIVVKGTGIEEEY
jgi:hypothetical protein